MGNGEREGWLGETSEKNFGNELTGFRQREGKKGEGEREKPGNGEDEGEN